VAAIAFDADLTSCACALPAASNAAAQIDPSNSDLLTALVIAVPSLRLPSCPDAIDLSPPLEPPARQFFSFVRVENALRRVLRTTWHLGNRTAAGKRGRAKPSTVAKV